MQGILGFNLNFAVFVGYSSVLVSEFLGESL